MPLDNVVFHWLANVFMQLASGFMQLIATGCAQHTILKPSSNWSLFKLIISDQRLIKLKLFLPI